MRILKTSRVHEFINTNENNKQSINNYIVMKPSCAEIHKPI